MATTSRTTLTDEQIAVIAEAISGTERPSTSRSLLDRSVAIGGAVLAVISIIFTVGVSWGRIVNLEQDVTALKTRSVQADIAIANQDKAMAIVNTRLEVIQRDVATLLGRTERAVGSTR